MGEEATITEIRRSHKRVLGRRDRSEVWYNTR